MTSVDIHLSSACNRCESKWVLDYLNRKLWSKEEDELLLLLVSEHKRRWKKIATYFPNKKPSQCIYRYQILKGLPIYNKINKKDHKKIKQCVFEHNNSFEDIQKLFTCYKPSTLLNKYKEITNNKQLLLSNSNSLAAGATTCNNPIIHYEQPHLKRMNSYCCADAIHQQYITWYHDESNKVSDNTFEGNSNSININKSNITNKFLLLIINHCIFLLNVYNLYRNSFFVYTNMNNTVLHSHSHISYINTFDFLRKRSKQLLFIVLRAVVSFCKRKRNANISEDDCKYLLNAIEQCHEAFLCLINITKVSVAMNINND